MFYDQQENSGFDFYRQIEEIKRKAKEIFGWKPDKNEKYFDDITPEPLSDNRRLLKEAITASIDQNDRVLTTPVHRPFFEKAGYVAVYDISPAQLAASPASEKYWCDVFYPPLLAELLSKVQPTALYLSNIPEYAKSREALTKLCKTINAAPTLNKVLFSRTRLNPGPSDDFAKKMEGVGWEKTVFTEKGNRTDKIFSLTKKT